MKTLKLAIKSLLRTFGLDIHGFIPSSSPTAQIVKSISYCGTDLVLDVGANIGQFGQELRTGGYSGNILSFEPLSDAHSKLKIVTANDNKWMVHERCAIGNRNDIVEINIAANSTSSSLRRMLKSHVEAAPYALVVGTENVPLRTLDHAIGNYCDPFKRIFLKIDTQGFEWEVLDGAPLVLGRVSGIVIELSIIPLYEGQHLWRHMVERLEAEGFTLWGIQPGFTDQSTGRTLQFDAIFMRNK